MKCPRCADGEIALCDVCDRPNWFDVSERPPIPMETVHLLVDGKVIIGWNEAVQDDEDPSYCSYESWPESCLRGEGVTKWAPLLKAPKKE